MDEEVGRFSLYVGLLIGHKGALHQMQRTWEAMLQ